MKDKKIKKSNNEKKMYKKPTLQRNIALNCI